MIKRWGDVVSGTGTIVSSLLSCAMCPFCLPIYAGFLSLIGIELAEIHYLFLPAVGIFGLSTLGFMAYQIYTHHASWLPFKLAIGAAGAMIGCVLLDYEYLLYLSLFIFMGSILWSKKSLVHDREGAKCC